MTETEEILAARDGDADSASVLFARHWRLVRAWMSGYTRDWQEAEDLTQEAFLRAWKRLPQLRNPDCFLPWLRRVAQTVARSRRRRVNLLVAESALVVDSASDIAGREEVRVLVDRTLDRLPARDRSLLALVYSEDISLAGAARLLGLPVTTFRRRLAKALGRFRRVWREGGSGNGLPPRE